MAKLLIFNYFFGLLCNDSQILKNENDTYHKQHINILSC